MKFAQKMILLSGLLLAANSYAATEGHRRVAGDHAAEWQHGAQHQKREGNHWGGKYGNRYDSKRDHGYRKGKMADDHKHHADRWHHYDKRGHHDKSHYYYAAHDHRWDKHGAYRYHAPRYCSHHSRPAYHSRVKVFLGL